MARLRRWGKDVAAPADVEVIDARGEYVLPGLVDPHSHLGVYSLPALRANSDGNEMTGDIEAQVRSEDSINTDDPEIAPAVSGGVTTVQILPGSGNNIGGWATIVKLNGGQTLDEIKLRGAPPSMKWAWGENPKRVYGNRNQPPSTLMGEAAVVRQRLLDAQNYVAKWKAWEDRGKKGAPPERDLGLEALAEALAGKVRLNIHSYQVNHFDALFRIADEFHFQIAALHHALDAYMIAPEITHNGTVLVENGKIAAVGANVQVPAGAQVIDARGKVVTPGLMDAGDALGLVENSRRTDYRRFD